MKTAEEIAIARVPPIVVWEAWERAHEKQGSGKLVAGGKGVAIQGGKFRYQVVKLVPHQSFTIVWKAFLARLHFSHRVVPRGNGSEICYSVAVKGPFAWFIRYFLGKKIRAHLSVVLQTLVRQLEAGQGYGFF